MYVQCKKCGFEIPVSHRPQGFTNMTNIHLGPNTNVLGGQISLGPGGQIGFQPGGSLSFGPPPTSQFLCVECGHVDDYTAEEIRD